MSRLATSFVLAYHGCDESVAQQVIAGETALLQSDKEYDWLGPGAYFWESDPQRALEWAEWKKRRGDYEDPTVIGAAIDLGNCLDLVSRQDLDLLRTAYEAFCETQIVSGLPLPQNKNPKGRRDEDRVLRYLDCAVINHLHRMIESEPEATRPAAPFDTVRGMFTEGSPLYKGSGFYERSHVQIAVRNDDCIKGVFRPRS